MERVALASLRPVFSLSMFLIRASSKEDWELSELSIEAGDDLCILDESEASIEDEDDFGFGDGGGVPRSLTFSARSISIVFLMFV